MTLFENIACVIDLQPSPENLVPWFHLIFAFNVSENVARFMHFMYSAKKGSLGVPILIGWCKIALVQNSERGK